MSTQYDYLKDNIVDIRKRVENAAIRSGRTLEDITVIAVSKTVEPERIIPVIDEGFTALGENRVQELVEKYDIIDRECQWHLIGHLQKNKVKYIIDKVSLIHSVDRIDLAKEIQKKAEKLGKTMDVLIQVNVSGEESKFGIPPSDTRKLIEEINKFKNVRIRGLMTMAPFYENPEDTRDVFGKLHQIFVDIKKENIDNVYMDYLSMGMSNDFEVAIEEGANMVRIGTSLFGRRQY